MTISPSRTAAFDVLLRIEKEQAFSSVLLPQFEERLAAADRSLCHELTLGALRNQILLDSTIDQLSNGRRLDIEVRIALRLGLYQQKFLTKIPEYSAINESVNLVQRAKKTSAKGFVNAILRKSSREPVVLSFSDEIDRLSTQTSHPRWLIEKWIADFGEAVAASLAYANNTVPKTAFRILDAADPEVLYLIDRSQKSETADGCFITNEREASVYELAEKGKIYIQDEASQMVANAVEIPDFGRFIDICAAPGGKTGLIAKRYLTKSRLLAAGDLHWPRVEFLKANCHRQNVPHVAVIQYDAENTMPFADRAFDSVLVDAPCSGTGTIRHNPEIRFSLRLQDMTLLAEKQLRILTNASELLADNGLLIYSTCSLESEENEAVCERFLSANSSFQKVQPLIDDRFITVDGFGRTFPHRDNMDGFFIAAFRRR